MGLGQLPSRHVYRLGVFVGDLGFCELYNGMNRQNGQSGAFVGSAISADPEL